jgi:hypothetical protein
MEASEHVAALQLNSLLRPMDTSHSEPDVQPPLQPWNVAL